MQPTSMKKHLTTTNLRRSAVAFGGILACCLCLNLPPALAAPGSWTRKADLPVGLALHAGCQVDGILYVVGGSGGSSLLPTQLKTVFAYDPATDAWSPRKDMPTARRCPAAAAVNGIIYVIGGGGLFDPVTDVVEAYDPKTDAWITKAALSSPRSLVTVCAADGIIYAVGGFDPNWNPVPTVEAYDPATDQWTLKTNLPEVNGRGIAHAVNGIIYAFFDKRTYAYDPKTDVWTLKAFIPALSLASGGSASGVVDGIVYLFGGLASDDSASYSNSLAYDPNRNRFAPKRLMPGTCENSKCDSRRVYAACATIGGKIYVAGGIQANPYYEPDAFSYSTTLMFDPQGGMTPQILGLNCETTNSVRLAWQGEAGRLYGVQSTLDPAKGTWTRVMFSTGTNGILATNALVEATCTVPATDAQRFFRVIEAD
jgi:hypothetical protein